MKLARLLILTIMAICALAVSVGAYQRTVLVENFTNWG